MKGEVLKWVSVNERLPEIDNSDEWNKNCKITKDVLTCSKWYGMRFGRYYYLAGFWTVEGVTSSNGVEVDFWMDVPPPVETIKDMEVSFEEVKSEKEEIDDYFLKRGEK